MKKSKRIIGIIVCAAIMFGSFVSYNICSSAENVSFFNKDWMNFNQNDDKISTAKGKNNRIKISIMNDFHYFSKTLYSDCKDFNYDCSAEKKLLLESEATLDKAIEQIKEEKPDIVLVGGDMSKDSEKINHEIVANKLKMMQEELHQEGVDTKFFVTNGNHDINSRARDYSSGSTVQIPSVTTSEYKEIYKDFGYGEGSEFYTTQENVGGGLSYVTDIGKGFTLIVVDTCKYTPDQTKHGLAEAEVNGYISDNLLGWIVDKAKSATAKGNVPIVLQHHLLTPHFDTQELIGTSFLIEDHKRISKAYADAGIKAVFTGHAHASDITKVETKKGNELYDIMTSSLTGFPVTTRSVDLATENDKLYLDTKVNFLQDIDYIDSRTGNKINDIQEYAFNIGLGKEASKIMASKETVEIALNVVKKRGGIKGTLAKMLGVTENKVTDEIIKMIIEKLPKDEETAKYFTVLKCNFGVFYNEENNSIYLKQKVKKEKNAEKAIELYIPVAELKVFLEKLYKDIDDNIINNTEGVNDVFQEVVNKAFKYKADKKYTIYDYYMYVYSYYKIGFNSSEEESEEVIGPFKKSLKHGKKMVKNIVYKPTKRKMTKLLSSVELPLDKLIVPVNNNCATKGLVKVINITFKDFGDVWKRVGGKVLLSDAVIGVANQKAIEILYGMTIDTNVPEDNDFSCVMILE